MRKSIFDSKSEKKLYKKLKTHWEKYVNVYPQIPVRKVINYDDLKQLPISESGKNYLLQTEFDYVVCEKDTEIPIISIEFDGLSGGYSKDGKYLSKSIPVNDQHRKLKIEAKIRACELTLNPLVVVSYQECQDLKESNGFLMIIDAIIGKAIERRYFEKNYQSYFKRLSEAANIGEEAIANEVLEMEVITEHQNPIRRKISEITKKFPFWDEQIVFPNRQGDNIVGNFYLMGGLHISGNESKRQKLVDLTIAMRGVNFLGCQDWELFNLIGEYCLARKVEKVLGHNKKAWETAIKETPWTEG